MRRQLLIELNSGSPCFVIFSDNLNMNLPKRIYFAIDSNDVVQNIKLALLIHFNVSFLRVFLIAMGPKSSVNFN